MIGRIMRRLFYSALLALLLAGAAVRTRAESPNDAGITSIVLRFLDTFKPAGCKAAPAKGFRASNFVW